MKLVVKCPYCDSVVWILNARDMRCSNIFCNMFNKNLVPQHDIQEMAYYIEEGQNAANQ